VIDPADAEAPSVEVGATVRLRDDETGKTEVWTIVSSGSDPKAGKISADTALSKALLGRQVGDVASVAAGRGRRYMIEGIDPAPVKPAPAPAPRPSRERPASFSAEIAVFGPGQDADYEEWVRRNSGGYVLKRRDTAGEGYMLHLADCAHLTLTPGAFTLRTGKPRRCSRSSEALVQWCRAETGSPPHKCSSCFS
jgi:Transcription elongation factor, GreA/GreB, C-term